jgi:hypothetical protein
MRSPTTRPSPVRLTSVLAAVLLLAVAAPLLAEDGPLMGTWEWEVSVGGFAGETRTPLTEGFTWQLEFTAEGILHSYRDEVLQNTGTYTYVGDAAGGSLTTVGGNIGIEPLLVTLGEDFQGPYLDLVEPCIDCFGSRFRERDAVPVAAEQRTWGALKSTYGDR